MHQIGYLFISVSSEFHFNFGDFSITLLTTVLCSGFLSITSEMLKTFKQLFNYHIVRRTKWSIWTVSTFFLLFSVLNAAFFLAMKAKKKKIITW